MGPKHLPGELQEVSTESQGKGDVLSLRDTRTIVRGWSQPAPGPGNHGLKHSRRQAVLWPGITELSLQTLDPDCEWWLTVSRLWQPPNGAEYARDALDDSPTVR